jgi:predicted hydrolase (HD superfamily)
MNKQTALELLHKHMENTNLRRHCYAVGFAMGAIYDYLKENNLFNNDSPDNKEMWEILGIIHDSDYEQTKDNWSKHTLLTLEWIKEAGVDEEDPLYLAVQSHNNKVTSLRDPETQMEWALECVDELTGFIVAVALVRPDKKLSAVKVSSVKKKWGQKAFAAGVEREQIEQCEEKLGIKLDDFIQLTLKVMQDNSKELGL